MICLAIAGPLEECPGRRRLPSVTAAGALAVQGELRCAMGAEVGAEVGAEARLPESVHAAHPSRSKTVHDLEPRYGIEP